VWAHGAVGKGATFFFSFAPGVGPPGVGPPGVGPPGVGPPGVGPPGVGPPGVGPPGSKTRPGLYCDRPQGTHDIRPTPSWSRFGDRNKAPGESSSPGSPSPGDQRPGERG